MAGQYWISGPEGAQGPFDQLQVRGLVAVGQLTPSMEISTDGRSWQSAANVRGLFPEPAAPPALASAAMDASPSAPHPPAAETAKPAAPKTANPASSADSGWLRMGLVIVALAAFYVGGWDIAWAQNFLGWDGQRAYIYQDDIYLGHGIAIAVNGGYYGLTFTARFFNAPVFSWLALFIGFSSIGRALR